MIKNHLSKLMGAKRYSIVDVSKLTGMSTSTISNLYNEKVKRLDFDTLEKLCKLFNCKVQDLIEYIPDDDSNTAD
ncbi:helix-turn-helix transcriptional regulator [Fusobacterium ulcerans]|uniref:helix-turn-helix domain-containing protein n=1 Tax=Fusobacterium ulcerans TaxID=861 RepID=UPI0034B1E213